MIKLTLKGWGTYGVTILQPNLLTNNRYLGEKTVTSEMMFSSLQEVNNSLFNMIKFLESTLNIAYYHRIAAKSVLEYSGKELPDDLVNLDPTEFLPKVVNKDIFMDITTTSKGDPETVSFYIDLRRHPELTKKDRHVRFMTKDPEEKYFDSKAAADDSEDFSMIKVTISFLD